MTHQDDRPREGAGREDPLSEDRRREARARDEAAREDARDDVRRQPSPKPIPLNAGPPPIPTTSKVRAETDIGAVEGKTGDLDTLARERQPGAPRPSFSPPQSPNRTPQIIAAVIVLALLVMAGIALL